LTRNGGVKPPVFSVKVPSEAVVPVLIFPLTSLSVTAAFAKGAPAEAVPVTVLLEDALIVNGAPLLARPPEVTTMLPVVAPLGILTVMLLALQVLAEPAATPLKVIVLLP